MKALFLPFLLLILLSSCGSDSVDFQLNLEEGEEYFQTTSMKAIIDQDIEGYPMKTVMTVVGTMSFLVIADQGDNYLIEAKYKHIKMTTENPQGSMSLDSKSTNPNDAMSRIFANMVDQPFEFLIGKNGRISEVKGMETLWSNTIDDIYEIPYLQKKQIKEQLMKSYGEAAFKGNMEMVTAIFPEKTVKIGETWTIATQLESGMSANLETEYSLSDFNSSFILLKGKSTIKTENKDTYVLVNGMQTKYNLSGNMTSYIKVNKETGWILEAKIEQDISGDVQFKESAEFPKGLNIPMSMKTDMDITADYKP